MHLDNPDEVPVTSENSFRALLKVIVIFVGISGCFSVLFGAWLAHGGKALPVNVQTSLSTAQQYQLFHTLALLACVAWLKNVARSKVLLSACIVFIFGIFCFSGIIYLKAFFDIGLMAKLTPIGGVALSIGWLLVAIESKNIF